MTLNHPKIVGVNVRQPAVVKRHKDASKARRHIEADYETPRIKELADRLCSVVHQDRNKRTKYDDGNAKLRLAVLGGRMWVDALFDSPEYRLARFADYAEQDPNAGSLHRIMGAKGLSITLGSVDQLGNWASGKPLDDKMRKLPKSRYLARKGIQFTETFSDKSEARLSYGASLVRTELGTSMMLERKRAAANISTKTRNEHDIPGFEIIKRSSYLLDAHQLDPEQLCLINAISKVLSDNKPLQIPQDMRTELGQAIVEPIVEDRERRNHSTLLLPGSSTYYVLDRHQL